MLYIIRDQKDVIHTRTTEWEVAYFAISSLVSKGEGVRLEIRGTDRDILLCG